MTYEILYYDQQISNGVLVFNESIQLLLCAAKFIKCNDIKNNLLLVF